MWKIQHRGCVYIYIYRVFIFLYNILILSNVFVSSFILNTTNYFETNKIRFSNRPEELKTREVNHIDIIIIISACKLDQQIQYENKMWLDLDHCKLFIYFSFQKKDVHVNLMTLVYPHIYLIWIWHTIIKSIVVHGVFKW